MNVLIYVFDALRADHLTCYGYDRKTTPHIDALADDGVRYNQCFSPSTWTKPVGASLLTGAYPPTHGTRTRDDVFNSSIIRIPEILTDDGYNTVGFSTMGNVSATLGYDQGFDHYADLYKEPEIVSKRKTKSTDSEELEQESTSEIALPRAEDLTDRVIDWLSTDASPFFAFCWSIEPHIPYNPPEGYREFVNSDYNGPVDGSRKALPDVATDADLAQLIDLYDSEIYYNDHELGRIIQHLKELNLYNDTLIIALGDHGDAFKEHGQLTHGHLPYNELIHVPLIIKPTIDQKHLSVVEEITSLVDIAPTVAAATDVTDLPDTFQGRPLPPYGHDGSSAPVYSETRSRDIYPAFYSVRTTDWKYMEVDPPDRSISTYIKTAKQVLKRDLLFDILQNPLYFYRRYRQSETEFLFDIKGDPAEQSNLIRDNQEQAAMMQKLLDDWFDRCINLNNQLEKGSNGQIDKATGEQLRRLGYID